MRERVADFETQEKHLLSEEEEVRLAKLMEEGRLARMKLAENPNLSQREQRILASQIRDGFAARSTLIVLNLRLVGSFARKYMGRGKSYPELVQEGSLGLIRGADKYNYRRGRFGTYVAWRIRDAITASFRQSRDASEDDIFPLSLDEPGRGEDGETAPFGEIVADTSAPSLDERIEEEVLKEMVLTVCEQTLTSEEKEVVYGRFRMNQEGAPPVPGRHFVMHNSKAPILEKAFETIRSSPFAGALLAQLR